MRAPRLHVEEVNGRFVVAARARHRRQPRRRTHFALRAFDAPDMYFGALHTAGIDADGKLHALGDRRRHGAQYVSGSHTSG